LLPCGSAGLANALSGVWVPDKEVLHIKKTVTPLPKLILSGSATQLTSLQVHKLQYDDDIEHTYFINLTVKDILDDAHDGVISRILCNLVKTNVVTVHTGEIAKELDDENSMARERLIDEGVSKEEFADKITNYLAKLAQEVQRQREFVLITIGGETSYKCIKALNVEHLQVIDAILPSIPLCMDSNAHLVVTKSGNLGASTTLIDIIKYFKRHEI
ncbi:type III effector Hrp-dependent outer protein, partial [Candidatus Gastranaerophilus sp. (ex Termes propinquus)]